MVAATQLQLILLTIFLQDVLSQVQPGEYVFVTTKNGELRGQSHEWYRSFLGIPYAEPPLGDLRYFCEDLLLNLFDFSLLTLY